MQQVGGECGALVQLGQLEEYSKRLNAEEEERTKERQNVQKLHKKVVQARQRKQELQNLVENTKSGEKTADEYKPGIDKLLSINHARLEEVKWAYRLTGIMYERLKNGNVLLSWDTFYNSQFFESYHMEVKENADGRLVPQHHTIPSFIPIDNFTDLLNEDLREFIRTIDSYLNAFVTRQQQVLEIQNLENSVIKGRIKSNQSHDYIQLNVTTEIVNYQFTLQYHLTDHFPHQVGIESEGQRFEYVLNMDALTQYKQLLMTMSLSLALQQIVKLSSESSS